MERVEAIIYRCACVQSCYRMVGRQKEFRRLIKPSYLLLRCGDFPVRSICRIKNNTEFEYVAGQNRNSITAENPYSEIFKHPEAANSS